MHSASSPNLSKRKSVNPHILHEIKETLELQSPKAQKDTEEVRLFPSSKEHSTYDINSSPEHQVRNKQNNFTFGKVEIEKSKYE